MITVIAMNLARLDHAVTATRQSRL